MKSSITALSFNRKGIPIPADYRPLYKIAHVILILAYCCRSSKASLMKLHFLSWGIKSKTNMSTLREWIKNDFKSDYHIWGVEPTVNRALTFAKGEGFVEDLFGEYVLTKKGQDFFKILKKDKDLFSIEKSFLEEVGKNGITEQRIKDLTAKFF